jgi:hypothetical protein
MESTSDVMWQFGVPFQFYIFTTAIDCVWLLTCRGEERQI